MLLPLAGRFGWKGILVVLLVIGAMQFGVCDGLGGGGGGGSRGAITPTSSKANEDELAKFVGFVLDDIQGSWVDDFERAGTAYQPARLVLFRDGVSSGCGTASADVGPFYCPLDHKVYVDLSFYGELRNRFGAGGDFAQAYVIAHEIGHHIQRQLGVLGDGAAGNEASVNVELQADCLAGVWAHDAERRGQLEPGDLTEALDAAAAIGDDNIQRKTTGEVRPERWTHGSSKQRRAAFQRGHDGASLKSCGF